MRDRRPMWDVSCSMYPKLPANSRLGAPSVGLRASRGVAGWLLSKLTCCLLLYTRKEPCTTIGGTCSFLPKISRKRCAFYLFIYRHAIQVTNQPSSAVNCPPQDPHTHHLDRPPHPIPPTPKTLTPVRDRAGGWPLASEEGVHRHLT